MEYFYDAHFDDWDGIYTLKGVVSDISVYYEKFELITVTGHNKTMVYLTGDTHRDFDIYAPEIAEKLIQQLNEIDVLNEAYNSDKFAINKKNGSSGVMVGKKTPQPL